MNSFNSDWGELHFYDYIKESNYYVLIAEARTDAVRRLLKDFGFIQVKDRWGEHWEKMGTLWELDQVKLKITRILGW